MTALPSDATRPTSMIPQPYGAVPHELHLIEVLRAGIPSRSVASTLGVGRQKLVAALHREMRETAHAHRLGGSIVKGEYGEGKTHLLNWMYQLAHQENYVVSLVSLSKETPFNRIDQIYTKVAEAIHLPGEPFRGVERLLARLALLPDERMAVIRFAEGIHVKPRTVIRNYLESADGYHRYLLLGDLEGGAPLSSPDLRTINAENKQPKVSLPRVARKDYWDYVALLRFLIKLGGYAGWLVLFDEAEMIGLLGAGARATAYGNVADFLGLSEPRADSKLAGMHTVFSLASSFLSDILDRRHDLDDAPMRLPRTDVVHTPEHVKAALTRLMDAHALLQVSDSEVGIALETIRVAHGRAYGWEPQVSWNDVLANTRDARLRTRIRAAIEYLDITYLYGRPPDLTFRPLIDVNTDEDEAFFDTDEPALSSGEASFSDAAAGPAVVDALVPVSPPYQEPTTPIAPDKLPPPPSPIAVQPEPEDDLASFFWDGQDARREPGPDELP